MQRYYERTPITGPLSRFARSFFLADKEVGDLTITGPATGYPLLGYIWRGLSSVVVDQQKLPVSSLPVNIFCGQLERVQADVTWSGTMGHAVIEFTATGLYELFGFPGNRLVNRALPAEVIDVEFDARMTMQFSDAPNQKSYLEAFDSALMQQIDKAQQVPTYIAEAVRLIEAKSGAVRLSELLRQLTIDEHTFNREFKEIVGLSPKYFCRVIQFNNVATIILSGETESIAEMAVEAGFYDQSHFTKAFQEFVLTSPKKFLDSDYAHVSAFLRYSSGAEGDVKGN